MSDIALTVSVLALVAVVGLWIGNIKVRGVGFGIGGVLFGGIIVGHFVDQAGVTLSGDMLHFIQEFGLILFVYTIGIQVGPGFFASLRVSGLRLNLFAVLMVPSPGTIIQAGDLLHLVGQSTDLHNAQLVIGKEVDTSLSTRGTDLRVERVVVTNEKVLGKRIRDLHFKERYDVVISRLNRAGVELVASSDASLQFGDILNLVGRPASIDAVANVVGNAQQKLQQVQMLPVFIGIGLGVLLGSIPLFVPGFPVALKLGLAGGPLIMALILGRIGSIGKLYWFMPPSANLALRELGIVLFLAVVGLKSGGDFVDTLTQGEGLSWIGYGIFITAIPLITVGLLARIFAKMNYLTLCGMLAGSMTDPPALAFANNLHATSGAAALSYATVYPLVMFLRIITPQLLAVIFWGMG
ncbi:putative transporter [Salmonella enterica]|nr:putative transporter [Salmonella enterica]EMC1184172.1 putative transporter [Salmonella enterica]